MPDSALQFIGPDDVDMFPSDGNPERDYYIAELVRFYREAVKRLSPEEQVAHHYGVMEGFDAWAVGEVLGISEEAVRRHINLARRKILRYVRWKIDGKALGDRSFLGGDRVGAVGGREVRAVGRDKGRGVQRDRGEGGDAHCEAAEGRNAGDRGHEFSPEPDGDENHQHVCGDGQDPRRDEEPGR